MRSITMLFATAALSMMFAALPLQAAERSDVAVQATVSLQGCCYVYRAGVWICMPC